MRLDSQQFENIIDFIWTFFYIFFFLYFFYILFLIEIQLINIELSFSPNFFWV